MNFVFHISKDIFGAHTSMSICQCIEMNEEILIVNEYSNTECCKIVEINNFIFKNLDYTIKYLNSFINIILTI